MPAGNSKTASPANPARVYDYLLGGKDHRPPDRAAGKKLMAAKPHLRPNVQANRRFLARAVRFLAREEGISQFLDIGTGLPTMDNTHEVAQQVSPSARIVYVDNDPEVIVHAQALLTSTPEGATDYLQADLADPGLILAGAARTLDLSKPTAIMLLGILYMIPDEAGPYQIVATLADSLAPGGYLAISHPASDIHPEESAAGAKVYQRAIGIPQTNRTRDQVTRFFTGLDIFSPGVVPLNHWRPDPDEDTTAVLSSWAAVGRKQ